MSNRTVFCHKLKNNAPGLGEQPIHGALGQRIFADISAQAWQMWLEHKTRLINEGRLNLLEPKARQWLRQEMEAYLFGEGSADPIGYQKAQENQER